MTSDIAKTTLPGTVSASKPGLRLTIYSQTGCGLISALTTTHDGNVVHATELSPWITDAAVIWQPGER